MPPDITHKAFDIKKVESEKNRGSPAPGPGRAAPILMNLNEIEKSTKYGKAWPKMAILGRSLCQSFSASGHVGPSLFPLSE